jgi:signal transduction histidine kinase
MRERVGLVGGVLDVGSGRDGGFVVAAVLPLREVP